MLFKYFCPFGNGDFNGFKVIGIFMSGITNSYIRIPLFEKIYLVKLKIVFKSRILANAMKQGKVFTTMLKKWIRL